MFEVINHSPVIYDSIEKIETDNSKQAVANKMRDIAQRYTDASEKKEYINAAERFRFPYWDPFVPRNRVSRNSQATEVDQEIWGLPKILMAEAVYVKYPNKSVLKAIANPLRAYVLPDEGILSKKGRKPLNVSRLMTALVPLTLVLGTDSTLVELGTLQDCPKPNRCWRPQLLWRLGNPIGRRRQTRIGP